MTGGTESAEKVVVHVMRTYGAHGGELQLAQYFSATPPGGVDEHFAFVYRDPECARLFRERRCRVQLHALWPFRIRPRQSPRVELLLLLPLLLFLQIRFLLLVWRRRARIAVVHGFQAALVAWPAAMILRRPGWLYVHRTTKSAAGSHPLFRLIYRPYRFVGGNSQAVARSLEPLAGRDRLIVLENGVDWRAIEGRAAQAVPETADATFPVVACVGRLLPKKHQDFLIEAFAHVRGRFPTARLWIVGDGPTREALVAEARRRNLAEAVVFWGQRTDVPSLLRRATVFANASSWEGMSNAVLEAMALGVPSVVVDAPGVSECHIDGRTGIVVDRDAAAFADAVTALLDDPDRAAEMGHAARRRVQEQYSIEANRSRFLAAFDRLLVGA